MLFYLGILFPLLAFAENSPTQDSFLYFGHGAMSCKEYHISSTSAPQKLNWFAASYANVWAEGFLTFYDQALILTQNKKIQISTPSPSRLNEKLKINFAMKDDLESYCKQNPKDLVGTATLYHIENWYPSHLVERAENEPTELQHFHLSSGDNTCRDYNKARKKPLKYYDEKSNEVSLGLDVASETWLQGFVTAANAAFNQPLSKPMHSIQELRKYCLKNPDKKIVDFANDYVDQYLYNQPQIIPSK